jgi:hypothetical protein
MNHARVAKLANNDLRQLDQFLVLHKAKRVFLPGLHGKLFYVAAVNQGANVYIDPRNERLGNEGEELVFADDRISLRRFSFERMTRTPKLLLLFVGFRTKSSPTVAHRFSKSISALSFRRMVFGTRTPSFEQCRWNSHLSLSVSKEVLSGIGYECAPRRSNVLQSRPPGSKIICLSWRNQAVQSFEQSLSYCVLQATGHSRNILDTFYRPPKERDTSRAYEKVRQLDRQRVNNSGSNG